MSASTVHNDTSDGIVAQILGIPPSSSYRDVGPRLELREYCHTDWISAVDDIWPVVGTV